MLLVVDTNTVFSALHSKGRSLEVFLANKTFAKFSFVSPEYLFLELGRRTDKLLAKSSLSKEEISLIFSFLKKQIDFVSLDSYEDKVEEAKDKSSHVKDIPFVALALKLNCKILSGDKKLKECLPDRVITPSEATGILYGTEIA
ncbi:MAG: PIN domain-containing protein [Candidatus Woesearchaeota archaeon]